MRFDTIDENEEKSLQAEPEKKQSVKKSTAGSGSILELLNPLKSVNINSDLHSFYNFRESKESVEALLKAQTNLVFYVIHQNFMCDEAHKEFFRNMIGRFYDVPEKLWDYYQGTLCLTGNQGVKITFGLIILENRNIYKRLLNEDISFKSHSFSVLNKNNLTPKNNCLNRISLEEYWGGKYSSDYSKCFIPFNIKLTPSSNKWVVDRRMDQISFEKNYEYGRFKTDQFLVERKTENKQENLWFRITLTDFNNLREFPCLLNMFANSMGLYASLGLENFAMIINILKDKAKEFNLEFNDAWIPNWTEEEKKMIRSLSQTFKWSREYIFSNEEFLDLDVLGLNMTVPWDMELVKFFIKKGFGGRLSENKAVFDKVFKPLLTDEIVEMLFKLEYDKYQ